MFKRLLAILLLTYMIPASSYSATGFRPGDWVSYSLFRYINSITTDQHHVYFATTGGVIRYNLFADVWATPLTTSNGLVDNRVNVVAVEPVFNELWCATRGGVSRYNPRTESWTTYTSGSGIFLDAVHSIGVAVDGRLLFETPEGVAEFDVHRQFWRTGPSNTISDYSVFTRWHGARQQVTYDYPMFVTDFGYFFDPPDQILDHYFRSFRLTGVMEDIFSNVWIGTWGLNVGKASLRSLELDIQPTGLVTRNVTAMSFDGDYLWFGGGEDTQSAGRATRFIRGVEHYQDRGGITRFNRTTGKWKHYRSGDTDGLQGGTVTAIAVDTATVWFGTDNGVVRHDKKDGIWATLPISDFTSVQVTCMAMDDTLLWVGTEAGVNTINLRTKTIQPVVQPVIRDRRIYDMTVDGYHDLWIATDNGVYRRRPCGDWTKIEDPDSRNLNRSVFAVEMEGDAIWFGNDTSILKFTRTNGEWQEWLLPIMVGAAAFRMKIVDRVVWLGTRYGAAKFDREKENWAFFTSDDGLLDETVQAILTEGDHIWFGTPEGATRFYWNDPGRLD